jgi:hypothetical protein
LLALVRGSARGGVGTDNPTDLGRRSRRFDGLAAIPGKRSFVRGRSTSIGLFLSNNNTLGASALVGDGPLRETILDAVKKVTSPLSVSRYEISLAITMGFTLSIEVDQTIVAPEKTVSFTLQGNDVAASLGVKLTLGGG